jgi:hypothetical protein
MGAELPHLHADIGSGEVIIELLPGGDVRLSRTHGDPVRGKVTARELAIVLETARARYPDLIDLWNASRPA